MQPYRFFKYDITPKKSSKINWKCLDFYFPRDLAVNFAMFYFKRQKFMAMS